MNPVVSLHRRGMIAGEVLFHEQPTLLSMLGAIIICCVTIGVTVFENRSQAPQTGADVNTDFSTASEDPEKRPLVGV